MVAGSYSSAGSKKNRDEAAKGVGEGWPFCQELVAPYMVADQVVAQSHCSAGRAEQTLTSIGALLLVKA
jgi:hypothetical protein